MTHAWHTERSFNDTCLMSPQMFAGKMRQARLRSPLKTRALALQQFAFTDLFVSNGFVPIQLKARNGWYRELDNMVCSDTHGGKILIQADGTAAEIDVPVMRLEDM